MIDLLTIRQVVLHSASALAHVESSLQMTRPVLVYCGCRLRQPDVQHHERAVGRGGRALRAHLGLPEGRWLAG